MMRNFLLGCMLFACTAAHAQRIVMADSTAYHQRMEWFGQAKLGIFIHWGIYAVRGVSESWSFYNEQLPYDEYMLQQKGFTASRWNPKEWVDLIKESGATYTVITSKHHDGMALWDTKAGRLSMKKCTPAGRDLIKPFAEEVRRQGLRLGLYYSLLDWSHPDYPNQTKNKRRYELSEAPSGDTPRARESEVRWQRFCDFNFAQLKELAGQYGPDLWWFDGDWEQTAERWRAPEIVSLLRTYNPNCVVNSRIQGYGDYLTPERGIPTERPAIPYWELCQTINDSWGYYPTDTNYKSVYQLLRLFVDCLSMGGNLLLDIGPREDGTIPEEQVAALRGIGRWTRKHAEAVYQTRAGIPTQYFQGYTTLNRAGDVLYLYLPYRPNGMVEVKGLVSKVKRAYVVGTGEELDYKMWNQPSWSSIPGNFYVTVPDRVLDPDITVIALQLDGPIRLYNGEGKVITANGE